MKKLIFIPIVLCLFASESLATEIKGTIVSLSAEATMEVPNDEVVINFRVEERGKKLGALRKRVNQMSAAIKKSLAKEKGIKLKTSSRRVEQTWQNGAYPRKRDGWMVVQTGTIISKNLDEVPRWLDIIEKAGAKLQGLSFQISDAVRRSTQETLRIQAVHEFQKKAKTVVRSLGVGYFHILHLNTGSSAPSYPRHRNEMDYYMSKSKSMVSADAAPALSSGDSRISVSVSGDIEVEKKKYTVK